jgi:serine/threonine protein kinase
LGLFVQIHNTGEDLGIPPHNNIVPLLTSYRHTSEAYYRYLGSISSSSQFKLYPSHSCHLQQYVNALAARNETRRLNVQVMMVIMLQVCMGAQHLQSQSIVHRSMSATNIFIDKDTTV